MSTDPVPFELLTGLYRTPRGASAQMAYRAGTNDHNTLFSCMTEDEYGLASVHLGPGSVAVDVGAYAGGVAIGLALDNPGARVIAVEPLSANVELITDNVRRNGLEDRVLISHRAVAAPGLRTTTVRWAFDGTESGLHHRYVGNSTLHAKGGRSEVVDCVSLSDLVEAAGGFIHLLKIDCEGGEYELFLDADALPSVGTIVGEYHHGWDPLVALLDASHVVTMLSGDGNIGEFRAVPR